MDGDRIHFRCPACQAVMIAPLRWAGWDVTCPVCGEELEVPGESDEDLEEGDENDGENGDEETDDDAGGTDDDESDADGGEDDSDGADDDSDGGDDPISVAPASTLKARHDDLVISVRDTPVYQQNKRPMRVRKRTREPVTWRGFLRTHKVYVIGGLILLGLVFWAATWKWYYEHYVKAEAIMRSRGYGQKLENVPAPDPRLQEIVGQVWKAEKTSFADADNLEAAMDLMAAYNAALKEIARIDGGRARVILNNAAWMFATTPHKGLRDPERALKLARTAVVQSCRKDSGFLDTLAEALSINGQAEEAMNVAREALRLKPDDKYLIEREKHFTDLATRPAVPIQ